MSENIEEYLKLTPSNLALHQRDSLLAHIEGILDKMKKHLRACEWDKAREMLEHSPAGDGMGTDKDFIAFLKANPDANYSNGDECIGEVIERLESLTRVVAEGDS